MRFSYCITLGLFWVARGFLLCMMRYVRAFSTYVSSVIVYMMLLTVLFVAVLGILAGT
jgi:hypothetical protein